VIFFFNAKKQWVIKSPRANKKSQTNASAAIPAEHPEIPWTAVIN